MPEIMLKSVELGNGEVLGYREREGGNQVVLLIHGNMTSSKHWDLLMENLDPKYKLYALDLRGFGISTYRQPIRSLRDFAEDVKLFVDAIGLKKFALMGWSLGGGVAMSYAASYPEFVHKLILLASASTRGYPFYQIDEAGNPIPSARLRTREEIAADPFRSIPIGNAYANRDKEFLRTLWNSVIYTRRQPEPERYEAYLEDMLTQRNLIDVYHALNTFNISHVDHEAAKGTGEVDRIQAPTLVLWGRNDLVVSEQMQREIVEDIGENARLVYLENCGHSPLVDDLEQLIGKIEAFLEE